MKVGKSSDSLWSSATQDLSPPDRDPSLWKAAEVATFLELANFEDVVQLFVDNNIAGKYVSNLTKCTDVLMS